MVHIHIKWIHHSTDNNPRASEICSFTWVMFCYVAVSSEITCSWKIPHALQRWCDGLENHLPAHTKNCPLFIHIFHTKMWLLPVKRPKKPQFTLFTHFSLQLLLSHLWHPETSATSLTTTCRLKKLQTSLDTSPLQTPCLDIDHLALVDKDFQIKDVASPTYLLKLHC